MWAELCMENRDRMLFELNTYIESLAAYRTALENEDLEALTALLEEGKLRKEEVDG
jgi:prephenate dehydrogenase